MRMPNSIARDYTRHSVPPSEMQLSPIRPRVPKRSSQDAESEDPPATESLSPKRQRRESTDSKTSALTSALRQPGVTRSISRRVAFAQTTTAEFNTSSPSMSFTPLPKGTVRLGDEVERAVAAAGQTPYQMKGGRDEEQSRRPTAESDKSLDSIGSTRDETDTFALEENMNELLRRDDGINQTDVDHSLRAEAVPCVDEATVELEIDINAVLGLGELQHASQHLSGRRQSSQIEEEHTIGLEADINTLFMEDYGEIIQDKPREFPPPIATRRFSITPVGNSQIVESDVASSHVVIATKSIDSSPGCVEPAAAIEDCIFDLTYGELLPPDVANMVHHSTDFLVDVSAILVREKFTCGFADALIGSIHQSVVNGTSQTFSPDDTVSSTEQTLAVSRALQRAIRATDGVAAKDIAKEIRQLAESSGNSEIFELRMWLLSAIEQLESKLEGSGDTVVDEIRRLDDHSRDLEDCVASMNNEAARATRKQRLDEKRVSRGPPSNEECDTPISRVCATDR
jgi:hypothetical protein